MSHEATAPGAPTQALQIPAALNMTIAAAAVALAVACLWVAAHAPHWTAMVAAAFVFSFANNTIFSLLHECVHGHFNPRGRAKIEIALVTGKQAHDKRQAIKDRDWQRQRARLLSHRR